jgi:hypothetical protein
LRNDRARAELLPERGARVQHLVDLVSERELFWQGPQPEQWPREDFMEGVAGGWDSIFPNDAPWESYPDHGLLWSRNFEVASSSDSAAVLRLSLDAPAVDVELRVSLLTAPRAGVRQEVTLRARADTGPFFWASHPMLAVESGWQIDLPPTDIRTHPEYSGRLPKGAVLTGDERVPALTVEPSEGMFELRFAQGVSEATVGSADNSHRTQISWDGSFLGHLWLVTISNFGPIGLELQLEPSTSHIFDLAEAIAEGTAASLDAGDERTFWLEIESLDAQS